MKRYFTALIFILNIFGILGICFAIAPLQDVLWHTTTVLCILLLISPLSLLKFINIIKEGK